MAAPDARLEQRGLYVSIWVTTVLGVVGVAWGWAVGSQMILFDGAFAFIAVVVSLVLVRASVMAAAGPTRRYPYGREGATPLAVGIQGFVILGTLVYASIEAVLTIREGGSDFAPGWAVLYGVLATVSGVATWWWLRRTAGSSDLLVSEATAWKLDAVRGVGMVAGFTIMWLLLDSSWSGAAPYVDPAMVLVTCVLFFPAPVRLIRSTLVELLEGAPPTQVQEAVLAVVRAVEADHGLDRPTVLMTKVGPKLYVEVDVEVGPEVTVAEEHVVRTDLARRLDALPYDVWLTVEFHPTGTL